MDVDRSDCGKEVRPASATCRPICTTPSAEIYYNRALVDPSGVSCVTSRSADNDSNSLWRMPVIHRLSSPASHPPTVRPHADGLAGWRLYHEPRNIVHNEYSFEGDRLSATSRGAGWPHGDVVRRLKSMRSDEYVRRMGGGGVCTSDVIWAAPAAQLTRTSDARASCHRLLSAILRSCPRMTNALIIGQHTITVRQSNLNVWTSDTRR